MGLTCAIIASHGCPEIAQRSGCFRSGPTSKRHSAAISAEWSDTAPCEALSKIDRLFVPAGTPSSKNKANWAGGPDV